MMNTAARNSHVQVHAQVRTHIFNSLGTESLGHAEALSLICSGATRLFSKVSMSFYIPTSSVWGLRFPPILTNTCSYPSFTIKNIPMNVKWYVLLWFWFSFSWWPKMSKIFLCAYWPFVYLFWSQCVFIINWVIFIIEFMCSLYIVDTKSFTDNTIGKYFFHSMSFHSFESVLWCTKLFNFDEVYFTYWYGMIFFVTPSSPQKIQMLKPWSLIWSYWVMGPLGDNYI